jgi:hypothetical protein
LVNGALWWIPGVQGSGANMGGWTQMTATDSGAATSWTLSSTGPAVPTLSATWDSTNGRMVLVVSSSDSTGSGFNGLGFVIEVSEDGGVTWNTVRQCSAINPMLGIGSGNPPFWTVTSTGVVTAYDWEPNPAIATLTYQARAYGLM